MRVLPPSFQSVDISAHSERRGLNRKLQSGGLPNPLYDLHFTAPPLNTTAQSLFTSDSESTNDNSETSENNGQNNCNNSNTRQENGNDVHLSQDEAQVESNSEVDLTSTSYEEHCANSDSSREGHQAENLGDQDNPSHQLDRHLASLDPLNCYSIPTESPSPRNIGQVFTVDHLQTHGLLNDGNVCSLISVILSLHRLGIKDHLLDPHFCVNLDRTPDFPSCVFLKIMSALPSNHPFSLQLFISSWNDAGKNPPIAPGFSDVAALMEGLISNLQIKRYASRPPVFTEFLASFKCNRCGKDHIGVKNWDSQVQSEVPLLQLPNTVEPVEVTDLLIQFLDEAIETRCSNVAYYNRITKLGI